MQLSGELNLDADRASVVMVEFEQSISKRLEEMQLPKLEIQGAEMASYRALHGEWEFIMKNARFHPAGLMADAVKVRASRAKPSQSRKKAKPAT